MKGDHMNSFGCSLLEGGGEGMRRGLFVSLDYTFLPSLSGELPDLLGKMF